MNGRDDHEQHQQHACEIRDEAAQRDVHVALLHRFQHALDDQVNDPLTDKEYDDRGDQVDSEIHARGLNHRPDLGPVEAEVGETVCIHRYSLMSLFFRWLRISQLPARVSRMPIAASIVQRYPSKAVEIRSATTGNSTEL